MGIKLAFVYEMRETSFVINIVRTRDWREIRKPVLFLWKETYRGRE